MGKNRKLIAFITVFFMTFAAAFTFTVTANAAAFYPDIRVLLSVERGKSIELTSVGDYYLGEEPGFKFAPDDITISIAGNRPVLTSGKNTFSASSITFVSRDYSGTSAYIRMGNDLYGTCTYLGNVAFSVQDGKFRVINTLPVEHYLYGVVPHEMSNTFPLESLKALAVCARGYAAANCSNFRTRDYDILDTSADQVYHGYASKYKRAIAAVDETPDRWSRIRVISYRRIIPPPTAGRPSLRGTSGKTTCRIMSRAMILMICRTLQAWRTSLLSPPNLTMRRSS